MSTTQSNTFDTDLILNLNDTARLVLNMIKSFTKQYTEIRASVGYIAFKLGLSKRTVFRILKDLTEKGMIERFSRPGLITFYKVCEWVVNVPKRLYRKVWDKPKKPVENGTGLAQGWHASFPKDVMYRDNLPTEDSNESKSNEADDDSIKEKKENGMAQKNISTGKFEKDTHKNRRPATTYCEKRQESLIIYDMNQKKLLQDAKYQLFARHCSEQAKNYVHMLDENVLRTLCNVTEREVGKAADDFTCTIYNKLKNKEKILNASSLLVQVLKNLDNPKYQKPAKCAQNANKDHLHTNTDQWSQQISHYIDEVSHKFKEGFGIIFLNNRLYIYGEEGSREIPINKYSCDELKMWYDHCKIYKNAS